MKASAPRTVSLTVDDWPVEVAEGATLLDACRELGASTRRLMCWALGR